MYCIARRRDVDRCAFERANLMIGAIDIVVMAQTPQATSPRQRESEQRVQGCFNGEKCGGGSAESGRTQVVRGRTRPEDPKLWFWVSIVGYGTNIKEDLIDASIVVSPGSVREEECVVSARYSDESFGSVTPRFEENLEKLFAFPARHCPTSQTRDVFQA